MSIVVTDEEYEYMYSLRGAEESKTLEFWKHSLHAFALDNQRLTFTMSDVHLHFTRNGIVPAFFEKSLVILLSKGTVLEGDSLTRDQDNTLLTNLMAAMWNTVFSTASADTGKSYVSLSVLEEIEKCITHAASSKEPIDLILSKSEPTSSPISLRGLVGGVIDSASLSTKPSTIIAAEILLQLNDTEFEMVLRFLQKRGVLSFESDVVQIHRSSSSSNSKAVSEATKSILTIRKTALDISRRIERLQAQSAGYTRSAIAAKARDDKSSALTYLKLRKNVQATIQRLAQAHYNLEESLQTIESTTTNEIIIQAYSSAADALKQMRQKSDLNVENVEAAVERFQEEMDEMQQVSEAISSPGALTEEEQDALQQELDEILALDSTTASEPLAATSASASLPAVPSTPVHVHVPVERGQAAPVSRTAVLG